MGCPVTDSLANILAAVVLAVVVVLMIVHSGRKTHAR
jgi:hypothetical protein